MLGVQHLIAEKLILGLFIDSGFCFAFNRSQWMFLRIYYTLPTVIENRQKAHLFEINNCANKCFISQSDTRISLLKWALL